MSEQNIEILLKRIDDLKVELAAANAEIVGLKAKIDRMQKEQDAIQLYLGEGY